MLLMAMSYVLTARQSMHVQKCGDGMGVSLSVCTYIYFKDDFLLKVLQGKAGRGSKVDICPALTCCFSISKWLMGYLLPVRQDDFFFFFANYLFFAKKSFHVYWLSFLNTIRLYLVFFLQKQFFAYMGKAVKKLYFPLYSSLKITRKCFVIHNWILP